ncbi:uncharacterized protein LOC124271237 [Haliotis rubra]|uniref:uncharacterized protein LOC124271237 n=1 Tax=Haliotis rubra TaxID=36100 RepID=UPI001EE51929|nr:uncharacterized protein LOC124271237 [Haliotis rubra]
MPLHDVWRPPHVTNFKGETFTLPLPCNHVLADLTTPPSRLSKRGCRVFITGRAKFSGRQNNSDISYENQVEISVSTLSAVFTTSINERGFNNPHLTHVSTGVKGSAEEGSNEVDNRQRPNNAGKIQQIQQYKTVGRRRRGSYDLRVHTRTDEDGFNQVTIPFCQLNVKYRAHDGAFSLQTPVRSAERRGLCGRCGGKSDRGSSALTRQQSLQLVLASLYALSPVDHTDANIYPSCTALTQTFASCPRQRKPHATTFCGEMLTNPEVNHCLAGKGGKEHVPDIFANCFRFVCTRHVQCGKYLTLFSDCLPKARATELVKDKRFCT